MNRSLLSPTRFGRALAASLLVVSVAACDLAEEPPALDEQEVEVMADIVASALSDQDEGFVASVYDVTAEVDPEAGMARRFGDRGRLVGPPAHDRPWRGGERRWSHEYDPTTGEHTISFERSVQTPRFSKHVAAELVYIFHAGDAFVEHPRQDWDQVTKVDFRGVHEGEAAGIGRAPNPAAADSAVARRRTHQFERTSAWTLDGVHSATMTLDGAQTHVGRHTIAHGDALVAMRDFQLTLETDGVTISKPSDANDLLETSIEGTLKYTLKIVRSRGGEEEVREEEGEIELQENGRALLRFMGLRRAFVVDLDTGDVRGA